MTHTCGCPDFTIEFFPGVDFHIMLGKHDLIGTNISNVKRFYLEGLGYSV